MHTQRAPRLSSRRLPAVAVLWAVPIVALQAQNSPFMTGATALQTNILAWLTPIAIILVMNREEGDQRLWFVVDELDALGQIDGLKDALARLRKFGGRCVLGFQSVSQVSATYGSGEANTIVENCGSTLILRCSGSEHGGTSQFASRLIGEREVTRITTSRSRRMNELFEAVSHSEHSGVETAVMGSQIEQLPDLSGYLKLASSPSWQRVRLERSRSATILTFPRVAPAAAAEQPAPQPTAEQQLSVARDAFELE